MPFPSSIPGGMKIDIWKQRPVLGNTVGGLSGPAVHPVAVRMVYQVAQAVKVPLIGMGGISSWQDAVEFILAGATAVAVGTCSFTDPSLAETISWGSSSIWTARERHLWTRSGDRPCRDGTEEERPMDARDRLICALDFPTFDEPKPWWRNWETR